MGTQRGEETRIIGFDPTSPDGDYATVCIASRGPDGVIRIEHLGHVYSYHHSHGQGYTCPNQETKVSIFEYVIVEHPAKKDAEKGELERVVVSPTVIVAKDKDHAKTLALLELGKSLEDMTVSFDNKRVEVLVRPFA